MRHPPGSVREPFACGRTDTVLNVVSQVWRPPIEMRSPSTDVRGSGRRL